MSLEHGTRIDVLALNPGHETDLDFADIKGCGLKLSDKYLCRIWWSCTGMLAGH